MLDDFRQQASVSSLFEEDNQELDELPPEVHKQFLGMTPAQRFVIAFMLLSIVCLLGMLVLLVTEKITVPISL